MSFDITDRSSNENYSNEQPSFIQRTLRSPWFVYTSTFFITIATVLGTGVLGVPVKLAKTGFYPFLLNYVLCFAMQCIALFYTAELLQRAKLAYLNDEDYSEDEDSMDRPTMQIRLRDPSDERRIIPKQRDVRVDLHSMGKLFLNKKMLKLFDFSVILHFSSILVSYALAGSEAYGSVFGVNYVYLIFPYVLILSLIVIFGSSIIEAIISIFTFTKGSVLVFVVLITIIVGNEADQSSSNDWLFIGKPLLISTVALGGAVNLLPVCFEKVGFTKNHMRNFVTAIILGEGVVWVLNVLWCYYILKIVPQQGPVSLAVAEKNGQISTIPLIYIIREQYSQYSWIATLIDVFIMISITVSFVTMSTGFKHLLDGFIRSSGQLVPTSNTQSIVRTIRTMKVEYKKVVVYSFVFGIIYIMAQLNPHSLIMVMEYFTSMALNIASGVLVAVMMGTSRSPRFAQYQVPFVVPDFLYKARYFVMFYFMFAIVYDISSATASLVLLASK